MKIYKQTTIENDINRIAHEMVNIEHSWYLFDNGTVVDNPSKWYPKFQVDGKDILIRAEIGVIFIPKTYKNTSFKYDIIDKLNNIYSTLKDNYENKLPDSVINNQPLKNYQSKYKYMYTNVLIKNEMEQTVDIVYHEVNKNIKRLFLDQYPLSNICCDFRFAWVISYIDNIFIKITSKNIDKSFNSNINSIFYDYDNISFLEDNHTSFDFSLSDLRNFDNYLQGFKIILSDWGCPIIFEINKVLQKKYKYNIVKFHQITNKKIFSCELSNIDIQEVRDPDNNTLRKDICSECYFPLFDDNYILCSNINILQPNRKQKGEAICPICAHTTDRDMSCDYLIRFKFLKSIFDIIDELYPTKIESHAIDKNVTNIIDKNDKNITITNTIDKNITNAIDKNDKNITITNKNKNKNKKNLMNDILKSALKNNEIFPNDSTLYNIGDQYIGTTDIKKYLLDPSYFNDTRNLIKVSKITYQIE